MIKLRKKTVLVLAIITMLGISPLSTTHSFAKIEQNEGRERAMDKNTKSIQNKGFIVIFTEKIVNGEIEVQYRPVSGDASKEDILRFFLLKIII